MDWTTEEKLEELLRLPWTIVTETSPEGDRLLRVQEIPSAVGSGSTPKELETDLWDSLRESLRAYLHYGDTIPLPLGSELPWAGGCARLVAPSAVVVVRQRRQSWGEAPILDEGMTTAAGEWSQIRA